MAIADELVRGREAYDRRDWAAAYDRLLEADAAAPLSPDDLSRLATAAHLLGRTNDCLRLLQREFDVRLERGEIEAAIRCCFWIGMASAMGGDGAVAGGWFGRGWRLLDELDTDSVERGYLLFPQAQQHGMSGNGPECLQTASEVEQIGRQFGDPDLIAAGLLAQGRALLLLDRAPEGVQVLDEAMAGVAGGKVSPLIAGIVYCATVEACQDLCDFSRARQWTSALSRWCDTQPDLVPYTGQCAVHRGQIMRLDGALAEAIEEFDLAVQRYTDSGFPDAAGMALYERGDVHRMRGEYSVAAELFQRAHRLGRDPQPGSALLWLAQRRIDAAMAACDRLDAETVVPMNRARILPAVAEVRLAAGDIDSAKRASDELSRLAESLGCDATRAQAAHARGLVRLAAGDAAGALPDLRTAARAWSKIGAPFELARVHVAIGRACRETGDHESARMEFDSALGTFRELGAAPYASEVEGLLGRQVISGGLTAREVEVLRLVAAGKSNPQIARELYLSEKTVARHLSNIFTKIDVASRTAAAAYAYEHHLV